MTIDYTAQEIFYFATIATSEYDTVTGGNVLSYSVQLDPSVSNEFKDGTSWLQYF